ncbi:putative Exocyst complex component SEC10b [Nannochloris sp. 'desiccata']|nr:putative Exocyst complex component SEC10b [Chlorella desiccata (nom. nud.)]
MEHKNLTQALSTLRIKDQNFDFASFSADSFRVQDIIDKASSDIVLRLDTGAARNEGSQSCDQISNLLSSFQRLDTQLAELESQVQSRCTTLQDGVAADEAAHLARITVAERELAALTMTLRALETRGDNLTSFASRVGVRLQTVDHQRRRALRAAEALQHLAAFSRSEDLSSLPEIFQDDDRMEEAASIAAQLSTAVGKAIQSSYGGGGGGNGDGGGGDEDGGTAYNASSSPDPKFSPSRFRGHPAPGTLEAAAEQLELYRNVLDNRIVSKFDLAVSSQNFPVMAHCARIMAAAGAHGDSLLISRYISTRPLFSQPIIDYSNGGNSSNATDPRSPSPPIQQQQQQSQLSTKLSSPSSSSPSASTSDTAAVAAMRSLTELYSKLSSAIRDEAVVMEQVFLDCGKAVAALVERIFEQIVQTALETSLKPPAADASLDTVRSHLRLVAEAYRKTLALAEESAELAGQGGGLVPTELADAACGTALDRYMNLELAWLGGLGNQKLKTAKRTLQKELILDFISMNEEAVKRCVQVTPAGAAASAIRMLFHSGSNNTSTTIMGLSNKKAIATTTQACLLGQAGTHMLLGLGGAADRCVSRLAGAFKPDLGANRDAAARSEATASLGTLLQAIAQLESIACVEGLAQLVAAIDARTAAALERTLHQLFRKVAATLVAEQSKHDFRPLNSDRAAVRTTSTMSSTTINNNVGGIDTPTEACLSAVALLRAVGQQTAAHLHGRLMIVPPESLPGLLDGVGHLEKARVRAIAERREDWKTARVGDRPLHALFS